MDAELNELVEEDVAAKLSGLDIPSGSAAAVDPVMPVVDQPASGALCCTVHYARAGSSVMFR